MEITTLGSGCFWCTEAVFQRLSGVIETKPGYTGGEVKNPTYREICTGKTGHAEVIQIKFDPDIISFEEILEVFWKTHDPTTLNRQGNDVGTQYRSAIFYHNDDQRKTAEAYKKQLDESGAWPSPIVTEITEIGTFYEAEDYHKDYYDQHGSQPYCSFIIAPKIEKLKKEFSSRLKN